MKHKKTKQKKSEDVLYVGVREPTEIRRNLLESARETIHFLQRYEKLKAIRERKFQAILQLDNEMKELKSLVGKLKKSFPTAKPYMRLPKHKLACNVCNKEFDSTAGLSKHMKVHQPKDEKVVEHEIKAPKKRVHSDIERLENELTEIEGKLGEME